tara:strand:+ start:606 stop:899 length:294 start_codon:yes stop_codon:yes gene_type:complete
MVKIINFPNSPKSAAQIEAEAMELNKKATEISLRVAMSSPVWEHYEITAEDIECLEQFGEVMDFPSDVAARLITKLANQNKKLSSLIDLQSIDEPWS